jgi:hypothetical protein
MTGIYLFWTWVMVSSLTVYLVGRFRLGPWPSRLYRPLLVVAFSVTSLLATARYLSAALSGHTDYAIGFLFQQDLINPVVRLVVESTALGDLVYGPLSDVPMTARSNGIEGIVTLLLWEVMVEDLFLGTLFWLGVGTLWLRFVRRRTGPFENPRET